MIKYHPIPFHDNFECDVNGRVRNRVTLRPASVVSYNPYIVELDDGPHMLRDILALTYIGPINLPTILLGTDGSLQSTRVSYKVNSMVSINKTDYLLDDNLFRVIPSCSAYIISERGVVWSIYHSHFVRITYNHNEYMTVTIWNNEGRKTPRKIHRLVYETYVGPLDPDLTIDHHNNKRYDNDYRNLVQMTAGDNARKAFLSENNPRKNVWTPQDIKRICELLEMDTPTRVIAAQIGRDYDAIRIDFNHLIHRILTKTSYTNISKDYDLSRYNSAVNKKDSVLNEKDVIDIWTRINQGEQIKALATKYSCSTSTISKIRDRKTWKHVTDKLMNSSSTAIESSIRNEPTPEKK